MSDPVSAVRARVEQAIFKALLKHTTLGVMASQLAANAAAVDVDAALRAVPLSAETEGLRQIVQDLIDAWGRSWDCSRDPGHAVMGAAIEKAEEDLEALAAPTVAQAPQPDESELDRLVAEYKHIADNDGEHRIKDLVWLINELIYERDQKDKP